MSKAFRVASCKTLLKLTIPRIKLLRNRREVQIKQLRKEIAKLLENGQESTALIRVEHIFQEEKMMTAHEILELYCELILARLPVIDTQKECPLDLKEAISSICFAAPRCADLPELQQVQTQFAGKYGKEFVVAATELMPDSGVSRQIIELLSVRAPPVDEKIKLLKGIAEENGLEWDSSTLESEYLKPHEDLLNGPENLNRGSDISLPQEKNNEVPSSKAVDESHEKPDSSAAFESISPPEIKTVSVEPTPNVVPSAPFIRTQIHQDPVHTSNTDENTMSIPHTKTEVIDPAPTIGTSENMQFFPFVPPLVHPSTSVQQNKPITVSTEVNLEDKTKQVSSLSGPDISSFGSFQDILLATREAAESAEKAAKIARAAANLIQIRISDLATNRDSKTI